MLSVMTLFFSSGKMAEITQMMNLKSALNRDLRKLNDSKVGHETHKKCTQKLTQSAAVVKVTKPSKTKGIQ